MEVSAKASTRAQPVFQPQTRHTVEVLDIVGPLENQDVPLTAVRLFKPDIDNLLAKQRLRRCGCPACEASHARAIERVFQQRAAFIQRPSCHESLGMRHRPERVAQGHEVRPGLDRPAGQRYITRGFVAPHVDMLSVKAKFGGQAHHLAAAVDEKLGCSEHLYLMMAAYKGPVHACGSDMYAAFTRFVAPIIIPLERCRLRVCTGRYSGLRLRRRKLVTDSFAG